MKKEYTVLASGIDSLDISIDVEWTDEIFFDYLADLKEVGKIKNEDQAVQFPFTDQIALLKPYGRKGYEWILQNDSFTLTIGNWVKPNTRPSCLVSIRSLALWNVGAQEIVSTILTLLKTSGAEILSVKPSRIDLCVDITLPASIWNVDLIPLRVTRASYAAPHFQNNQLTGISIGKGQTGGRLYDKPLEINKKSHKFWMYDVWGVEQNIPENQKIIRIEGQFRRETIKQLGLNFLDETFCNLDKLWGYFTQDWLKFQNNPGKHHTMRKTLDWWEVVQNGFMGVQAPIPLIRCKAINQRKKQLYAQTNGTLTSILALDHEENNIPLDSSVNINDLLKQLEECYKRFGKSEWEMEIDLFKKRAKYYKAKQKMVEAHRKRQELGLPCNIPSEACSDEHWN